MAVPAADYRHSSTHTFFVTMIRNAAMLAVVLLVLAGCRNDQADLYEERTLTLTDEQAARIADEILEEVSLTAAGGLEISLWASEELLSDPVGINFDHNGRAWVATTSRRRSTVPDAGAVDFWVYDNLSWRSVEDRREFLHRALAPEHSDENTWLTDFNEDGLHDWRDMLVEKDPVYLLEDRSGNGMADQAKIMDWDLYSEVTEITGSVLYHEGELFVARSPNLWRIRDSNADGRWDLHESISHGYGVHFGYSGHGMSSLQVGPDGRIWWTVGDIGVNVVDSEGNHWYYPDEGAIMRAEPDGSNFEVFAAGLRNIHEFSFDKYGNLIAIDNDGPPGDYDRLVYPVDGSDSGWRIYWQMGKPGDPKNNDYRVWEDEKYYSIPFEGQAAHILPPLAPSFRGPAGFTYNPGTALDGQWEDHFFSSSFIGSPANSGINAFTLKEKGASFKVDSSRSVLRGVLATSLDFGTDGALYTADWVEGWVTMGEGRIWKLDTPAASGASIRSETRQLLSEDFGSLQPGKLQELLGHQDMRVRRKAQFELAGRGETEYFLRALDQAEPQLARIHGIWGLGQAGRSNPGEVAPLADYLNDADPEIRAQAAKTLGDVRYEPAGEALIPLLDDQNARVRFFAAEALGRIAYPAATQPIKEMLRDNNDEDPYLRQGGAIALSRIGDEQTLAQLADDPSPAVRTAALVALRRLSNPHVVRFLQDEHEAIVTDAARAIHDEDFIGEGLRDLAGMLEQDRFTGEPLLRRAINASLHRGTREDAERLAAFSLRQDIPEVLAVESLEVLAVWPEPSVLDRVTGRYRGEFTNDPAYAREAAGPAIVQILERESSGSSLKIAALQAAGSLVTPETIPGIRALLQSDPPAGVYIASLNALQEMAYEGIGEHVADALEHPDSEVRINAIDLISGLDLTSADVASLLESVLETGLVDEKQAALRILGRMDEEASYALLDDQLELLIKGELPREVQLDLILAVESSGSQKLQEKLRSYEALKPDDSLAVYAESLYGGNAADGQRVFANHADAQCYRCHTGGEAGPELDTVGDRLTREQILQAMVDPDARIAPGYGMVALTLHNGETIHGLLGRESEDRIIVSGVDGDREIRKSDIAERRNSPSAMPAMGGILSRSELRDLVEYLDNLREQPGTYTEP